MRIELRAESRHALMDLQVALTTARQFARTVQDMSVTRLQHITKIGVADMGDLADAASRDSSQALLSQGEIAATAMVNWGAARTDDYIRCVFANEPAARPRDLHKRVERSLRL